MKPSLDTILWQTAGAKIRAEVAARFEASKGEYRSAYDARGIRQVFVIRHRRAAFALEIVESWAFKGGRE